MSFVDHVLYAKCQHIQKTYMSSNRRIHTLNLLLREIGLARVRLLLPSFNPSADHDAISSILVKTRVRFSLPRKQREASVVPHSWLLKSGQLFVARSTVTNERWMLS